MAMTAQGLDAELNQIAVAVHKRLISEGQGEYLAKEAYQMAMMQFQVLSGLHDMLEEQMTQTPAPEPPAEAAAAAGVNGNGYHNGVRTVTAGTKTL